ncbi:MAG: hypothetical protein Q9184_007009 [Pyrenodesmia sp. 2 TL-2023]
MDEPHKRTRPHLLSLPLEIREQIYDHVLDLNVSCFDTQTIQEHYALFIPRRIPRASAAAVLRCNRQIYMELSQRLASRVAPTSRNGLTYELKVVLEGTKPNPYHGIRIYPTWTKIPMLPISYAKCLYVYLQGRAYGNSNRHFDFEGDRGLGQSTQDLLNLLARFFAYGATFNADKPMLRPQYVEELVVDVLPVEVLHLHAEHDRDGPINNPDREMRESLGFLDMVAKSGLLFGRLGRISAYVDGKYKQQWKVIHQEITEDIVKEWNRYGWIPKVDLSVYSDEASTRGRRARRGSVTTGEEDNKRQRARILVNRKAGCSMWRSLEAVE